MRPIDQQFLKACHNGDTQTIKKLLRQGANPHILDDLEKSALHYALSKKHHDIAQYLITELKLDPNIIENEFGHTPFLIATYNGNLEILQLLIQHGANPHTIDYRGRSALHYAIENQKHDIAHYLITELKLDPNQKDELWRTPLMLASANGDIKTIQLLIQLGADPHTIDHNGRSALHYALANQNHNIAQYLLTQLHINPNTQDQQGQTPFLLATQNGDIHILKRLIQHGADPHIRDCWGKSALHYALEKRYYDIAKYLITQLQLNPNIQDQRGTTPFMIAAQNGDIDMLRLLIQHGADPYATDQDGRNALHYAVKKRYHNIAQYLLIQLQFDPNLQDHDDITPFLLAVKNGDIHMLQLLIQHGANPYVTDQRGRTALHYAVEYDDYNVFKYLITQLKPDPNAQDHNGNTPLLIAINYRDQRIVNTLIQLGANPHIPNHQGETPAAIAHRRIPLPKPQPSTITL